MQDGRGRSRGSRGLIEVVGLALGEGGYPRVTGRADDGEVR